MVKSLRYVWFASVVFLLSLSAKATHNRGGEIMYKRLSGFTYEFRIIVYTDDGSNVADRCSLTVHFGDGDTAVAYRVNGSTSGGDCGPGVGMGQIISTTPRVKKNEYVVTHTYSGAFDYTIYVFDRNRNGDSRNIPNSINQPFYLETKLSFDNFTPYNNSPIFSVPPIDRACIGKCFYHNPGAYDPDGDSLSYELTIPRGEGGNGQIGVPIPGYVYPSFGGGNGKFEINAQDGTLSWCSPVNGVTFGTGQGEYNVAFLVKEWRKFNGVYRQIGYVLRDMQIIVEAGCNNEPPVIVAPADTCVEAGTIIQKQIKVSDPDGNPITLQGFGGSFSAPAPTSQLSPTSGTGNFTSNYIWQTACVHIRKQPYQITLKAEDSPSSSQAIKLVDFKTFNIRVVAPSPKNLSATPQGVSINLSWQLSSCSTPSNRLISYKIFRRIGCSTVTIGPCDVGVNPAWGYTNIGAVTFSVNTFTDNNNGNGLSPGIDYSYIVIAVYADGSESYASTNVCARLKRDVPLLLNADVLSTHTSTGSVFVRWTKPVVSPTNLDTIQLPGPYTFNLLYKAPGSTTYTTVYSVTKTYFAQLKALSDTTFTHSNLDTETKDAEYKVEFIATPSLIAVGTSQRAKTIFLTAIGGERKVNLSWNVTTPWINTTYEIYRSSASQPTPVMIGTTTTTAYEDNAGVVNLRTYCYYVRSIGAYTDPNIFSPLFNRSQTACATARDVTPPCSPTITLDANCVTGFVQVRWTNPNASCADDVLSYKLYTKPTESDDYTLLTTFNSANSTVYTLDGLDFIAACYAVTAIDSSGNESAKSLQACVENCPEFELPNIVTVNGDNVNDIYKAIKVRHIKEIDLQIYNRWGSLMYETRDPYFNWNATNKQTGQVVSEGTYFYTCIVYFPTIKGIQERKLKGFLQVVR
ncbi:MAG: gliding motility-associated C-terminal domain-containing protein [Sediminibacterium sp.]|nr:gliding motility-associated C-terminal domain-containing protein [Sediminibacterium sp.]